MLSSIYTFSWKDEEKTRGATKVDDSSGLGGGVTVEGPTVEAASSQAVSFSQDPSGRQPSRGPKLFKKITTHPPPPDIIPCYSREKCEKGEEITCSM